jgi:hypothetical protein
MLNVFIWLKVPSKANSAVSKVLICQISQNEGLCAVCDGTGFVHVVLNSSEVLSGCHGLNSLLLRHLCLTNHRSSRLSTYIPTYTHVNTYIFTYINTYVQTYIYTHMQYIHMYIRTYIRKYYV